MKLLLFSGRIGLSDIVVSEYLLISWAPQFSFQDPARPIRLNGEDSVHQGLMYD